MDEQSLEEWAGAVALADVIDSDDALEQWAGVVVDVLAEDVLAVPSPDPVFGPITYDQQLVSYKAGLHDIVVAASSPGWHLSMVLNTMICFLLHLFHTYTCIYIYMVIYIYIYISI